MGGKDGLVHSVDMLHQVLDLCTVLLRQAVACRVRKVDDGRTGLDDGLDPPCEVLVVGPSGVLGVELDVLNVLLGVLDGPDGALEDVLPVGVELVLDVGVGCSDSCVDSLALCSFDEIKNASKILDLGTGAGFPGLVLAILFNNISVTLVESNQKKCGFLEYMCNELNLNNVNVVKNKNK